MRTESFHVTLKSILQVFLRHESERLFLLGSELKIWRAYLQQFLKIKGILWIFMWVFWNLAICKSNQVKPYGLFLGLK